MPEHRRTQPVTDGGVATEHPDAVTITDNTFFVLSTDNRDHVFADRESAITALTAHIAPTTEEPDATIAEVTVRGDDWTIKELPWRTIALQLMQGGDGA